MKNIRLIIVVILMLASKYLSAQSSISDPLEVKAINNGDSITFKVSLNQIETQLAFLMQGLNITIVQPDTLTISFPTAAMVKNKVKRHPNEVKAVLEKRRKQQSEHDSVNHVVRPDVQPLVAALNDTTATVYCQNEKISTREYKIDVNRKTAIMTFSFVLHENFISPVDGSININLFSAPFSSSDRTEFAGRRLSAKKPPHPNGLGEGIRKEDVSKRTYKKSVIVKVEKCNE